MADPMMKKDLQVNSEEVNMWLDPIIKIAQIIADHLMVVTIVMSAESISKDLRTDPRTIIARTIMAVIAPIANSNQDMVAPKKVEQVDIVKISDLAVIMEIARNMVVLPAVDMTIVRAVVSKIVQVVDMTIAKAVASKIVQRVASKIVQRVVMTIVKAVVSTIVVHMNSVQTIDLAVNLETARNIVVLQVVAMIIMKEDPDNLMIAVDMVNRE